VIGKHSKLSSMPTVGAEPSVRDSSKGRDSGVGALRSLHAPIKSSTRRIGSNQPVVIDRHVVAQDEVVSKRKIEQGGSPCSCRAYRFLPAYTTFAIRVWQRPSEAPGAETQIDRDAVRAEVPRGRSVRGSSLLR